MEMKNLVKLTGAFDNTSVYIMAKEVLFVSADDRGTVVVTKGHEHTFAVKESPKEVAKLIEETLTPVFVFGDINTDESGDAK